MSEFDNIDGLLKLLTNYCEHIDNLKKKLEHLDKLKKDINNNKCCEYNLIIYNFDLKINLQKNKIENKTKILEIIINRFYYDICYIQSLLINLENKFFYFKIITEKKIDKNMFKKKEIRIGDFKEMITSVVNNYMLISNLMEKLNMKIKNLHEIIKIEFNGYNNTLFTELNKLKVEHGTIFELINQTINFYYDISKENLIIEQDIINSVDYVKK
jgi:hypothetical protein